MCAHNRRRPSSRGQSAQIPLRRAILPPPGSQSLRGLVPIKIKGASASSSLKLFAGICQARERHPFHVTVAHLPAATSLPVRTLIFAVFSICSIKYCDMVSRRLSRRTIILNLWRTVPGAWQPAPRSFLHRPPARAPLSKCRCLSGCGAVVHARSGKFGDSGRRMLAIEHSRAGQNGSRYEFTAIAESQPLVSAVDSQSSSLKRRQKLRTQTLRLRNRASGQFAAAYACRDSKIIFNPRA